MNCSFCNCRHQRGTLRSRGRARSSLIVSDASCESEMIYGDGMRFELRALKLRRSSRGNPFCLVLLVVWWFVVEEEEGKKKQGS